MAGDDAAGEASVSRYLPFFGREREEGFDERRERPGAALLAAAAATAAILFFIIIFVALNGWRAVSEIGAVEFLTGFDWIPSEGAYGALSLITGTALVTGGAILFALPAGLGVAIYMNDVASPRVRNILKPACELLAGIPSVVFGFIGMMFLIPLMLDLFPDQLSYGSSWLAGSVVLGIMTLPTIISVSQDSLAAVPRSYREASMALGATKWHTTRNVLLKSAVSGIAAAAMLGVGRALGETMAVMMVTGNTALVPEPLWNVFSTVRTLTSNIALEMSEVSFGSLHFSALFFTALILMAMVVAVNIASKKIVKRTKAKMTGDLRSGRLSAMAAAAARPVAPYFGIVSEAAMALAAFGFAYMMLSLVAGAGASAAAAGALAALFLLRKRLSRMIGAGMTQKAVYASLWATVALVVAVLAAIVGIIVFKGLPALSPEFLFDAPLSSGRAGGIGPAIVGTLELMAGTAAIGVPLGVLCGIYLAKYAGDGRFAGTLRQAIDILNGTPAIIFGLFGMSVMVIWLGMGYTLIGGCVTLALMIMPTIVKTTEEAVRAVPADLTEASMALGASKKQTIDKVVVPAAMGGIITGMILGIGRSMGEAAPIMFTAAVAFKAVAGVSVMEPVMALPYHLYYLATEVPGSATMQYGTALVLLIIAGTLFAAASYARHRYGRFASG
ncbi:MAG: phosphate ABC transporter permease subunit PstC [Candidatus Methanoplasma sp.]|jgi:phosphate transport system permease protein|nr:phosphate ABC transporter permease subunit PstC [Candidatus Methanoplasma sp.]